MHFPHVVPHFHTFHLIYIWWFFPFWQRQAETNIGRSEPPPLAWGEACRQDDDLQEGDEAADDGGGRRQARGEAYPERPIQATTWQGPPPRFISVACGVFFLTFQTNLWETKKY